jgi:hypothetical protein
VSGKKNNKTETSVFVIWNFYSFSTPKQFAIFAGKAIQHSPLQGGIRDALLKKRRYFSKRMLPTLLR